MLSPGKVDLFPGSPSLPYGPMARIALKSSALVSPSNDGYLVYDVETERLHHLNPTASLVIELCDGTRDVDAIRDALLPLLDDTGWDPCRVWLEGVLRDGLLVEGANSGPSISAERLTALATGLWEQDYVLPAFICQQRAAELEPDNARIWYDLGELAYIIGRRDEACAAYQRYLEKRPGDAEIEHLLVSLRGETPPERVADRCIEQLYARFAKFYDETMTHDLEYRGPALLGEAVAVALAGRHQLDVVDLGCGTGLSGQSLRPLAKRLAGVDLSPAMIERARVRDVYDALHVSEITTFLRECDGRFDLIAACDTLIYFGDLRQVVPLAARRLAPGGIVAFTVERSDAYPFQLTDSGRFAHHPDHLREVAGRSGLDIASMDDAILRYEYGNQVSGLVAVFRKSIL